MSAIVAALMFGPIGLLVTASGFRMRRNEVTVRGRRAGWSTKVIFIGMCFIALATGLVLGL